MDAEITVIGAGVLGLAIARDLSEESQGVFVIEKNFRFGQETSSRNSEVIHSGVYYPPGSLKATLCVEGKWMLYDFLEQYDIAHKKCGKLVVAVSEEETGRMKEVWDISGKNGVTDREWLNRKGIESLEPHIRAVAAIHFPSTGILDSHGLMKQLEALARIRGAEFVYGARVTGIERLKAGYRITLADADGSPFKFTSRKVINAAGLEADRVAALDGTRMPGDEIHFWKGQYFRVTCGKHRYINRLIYPLPDPDHISLGLHATIDLNGQMKLGPDAVYLPERKIDYRVDPANASRFFEAAGKYLPFLEENDLIPDQAGIRPKLQKPGGRVRDWVIRDEGPRGYPGRINLIGMDSPALTACLAIARYVKNLIFAKP